MLLYPSNATHTIIRYSSSAVVAASSSTSPSALIHTTTTAAAAITITSRISLKKALKQTRKFQKENKTIRDMKRMKMMSKHGPCGEPKLTTGQNNIKHDSRGTFHSQDIVHGSPRDIARSNPTDFPRNRLTHTLAFLTNNVGVEGFRLRASSSLTTNTGRPEEETINVKENVRKSILQSGTSNRHRFVSSVARYVEFILSADRTRMPRDWNHFVQKDSEFCDSVMSILWWKKKGHSASVDNARRVNGREVLEGGSKSSGTVRR
ncbi:hypothetical protein RRG08_034953 [Elysia crispata]|uniref:Uncharacterized protein n=1 Tax=Elysia crispata TaxID=231223 RepID=A0AAE1CR53_9GAST|nr:hypothetical protein RRG08_034953 [Elysia crispata]